MVALAMGAAKVIAIGRDGKTLLRLAEALGPRVHPAVVAGQDATADRNAIRAAAGGDVDMALDLIGGASRPTVTLATLRSLRRCGRLVLMGSASAPVEVNLAPVRICEFPFSRLPEAIRAAASMRDLDLTTVVPDADQPL